MRAICYLAGTNRYAGSRVVHDGASGVGHTFLWSEKHQKHILEGRELELKDNKVLFDLFTKFNEAFYPVVEVLAGVPAAAAPAPTPAPTPAPVPVVPPPEPPPAPPKPEKKAPPEPPKVRETPKPAPKPAKPLNLDIDLLPHPKTGEFGVRRIRK